MTRTAPHRGALDRVTSVPVAPDSTAVDVVAARPAAVFLAVPAPASHVGRPAPSGKESV